MALKIYTKTGDKGITSLFGGTRVSKADKRVETYGEVDELNSAIGVAIAEISSIKYKVLSIKTIKHELEKIQHDLLTVGSTLANPKNPSLKELQERVQDFEKMVDNLTEKLPELRNFILPGGGKAGSMLHLARTVCRRIERRIVRLAETEKIDSSIRKYFNRLSDLLFTMARFVNYKEKQPEAIWVKNK